MRSLIHLFGLGFSGFLLCCGATPASSAESVTKPLAEAAVPTARTLSHGGIVTAESKDGEVRYAAAGHLPGTAPEHLIFEIGSISKVFTGLLLAQAVTEHKVTLDSTIAQLLGKDQRFADPRVGAITLRQLSTHTSGLPRLPENFGVGVKKGDPYASYDREKLLAGLAEMKLPGDGPFELDYSNLGVGLLGDLLSRVYDKPWEDLVKEKITGPFGMNDTVIALSPEQESRFVPPYDGDKKVKAWNFDALKGCGALRSTASDMVIFGKALLHPEQTPLKDAIALMEQPQTKAGDIGLNLMISVLDGKKIYEHNGGTAGFRSFLQVEPGTGTVRVLLANNAHAPLEKVLADARGEKPRVRDSGTLLTKEQLAAYPGIYKMNEHVKFTMVLRGDQLWTKLTGQTFLRLFPHELPDRFFLKAVAAEIQFTRGEQSVTELTLFQNGRTLKAQKLPDAVPDFKFPTEKQLAAYTGTYTLSPKTVFTLTVKNATLFAQLTGQEAVPVFETRNDRFEYDVVDAALEFQRDKTGKITALLLHQNGIVQRAIKR